MSARESAQAIASMFDLTSDRGAVLSDLIEIEIERAVSDAKRTAVLAERARVLGFVDGAIAAKKSHDDLGGVATLNGLRPCIASDDMPRAKS